MSTPAVLPCCRRISRKGKETVIFETASGQRITLNELAATVTVEDGNGNLIRLDVSGVTIQSAARVNVQAAAVEINAGILKVNSPMTSFSGTIKADTLIAN